MKVYFLGFSVISASAWILLVAAHPIAWAGTLAHATVTATMDGTPWRAENAQGTTLTAAGKPQLNFAATRQGGGIQVFTATLPLREAGVYEGNYVFAEGARWGKAPTANFSVPGRSEDLLEKGFTLVGNLVIEHYDAAAKTISGHFSVTGETHGHGAKISIADGKFSDVPIDPVVTPGP